MDKAWESLKPQIDSVLNSLGIKSILDMFSSPEFQYGVMPVAGAMGLGGMGGMGNLGVVEKSAGTGGGATSISAPTPAIKSFLDGAGAIPTPQKPITEALQSGIPMLQDQVAVQRLSDLLKLIGGQ
jgi:hypothetical protein